MIVSFYLLFEVLTIVCCLHYLYGEKIRPDKYTILLLIVDVGFMHLIKILNWDAGISMLIYPIIAIYCAFKFGLNYKAIFINNILYLVIMSVLQFATMLILVAIFRMQNIYEKELLAINIIVFLIMVVVIRKCKLKKISEILQANDKIVIASSVVVIIGICSCLFTYKTDQGFNMSYYILLVVSVILICLTILDIGKHKVKVKEAEAELRLHKLYEESFKSLIDDISARQHEFDNHINAIYSQHMIYHTYEELTQGQKQYCDQLIQENSLNKLLSNGNSVVLGFLYGKFLNAEKSGIKLNYRVNIRNLESNVPTYKMVELLGNLINNAVEALSSEEKLSRMGVSLLEYDDSIEMEVRNECIGIDYSKIQDFFKKGYSEKEKNRGYGLYNVKQICESYNIRLQCSIEDAMDAEWFVVKLNIRKPL